MVRVAPTSPSTAGRRVSVARVGWACLLLAIARPPLAAQSLTNGSLIGEVRAADGSLLFDALVTVTEERGGWRRSVATRRDGAFAIALLPAGSYDVLVEHLGYRPKRLVGVPVAAGGTVRVPVTLAGPAEGGADSEAFGGMLSGSAPAMVDRVSVLAHAPEVRSDVGELTRRSSALAGGRLGDGLPGSLGGVYWDGVAVWSARHPAYAIAEDAVAVPLAALGSVDLVANGVDVEWGGSVGPILSAHSAQGTGSLRVRVSADATNDALSSSKYYDTRLATGASLRTTATVSGPLIRDSAEFLLGVDVQRLKQPRAPLWPGTTLAAALVDVAQDSFNVDLSGYLSPGLTSTQATTLFGRFDWRASRNHAVSFHGLARSLETDLDALDMRSAGRGAQLTARDYTGMVAVSSALGARLSQELRLAFTRSTRDYEDADVPPTRIVDAGLAFGGDPSLAADIRRTTVQAVEALHIVAGRHRLKVGGGVTLATFDQTFADEAAGAFTFGGTAELTARRGVFRQTVGVPPLASFAKPELAGFLQDRWAAAPGLDLVFGLRIERETLPAEEVSRNDSLLDATGLDNGTVPSALTSVAPRLGLRWDVGERGLWVVRAAAAQYRAAVDPGLLSELITGDDGARGRRGVGDLGAWPVVPDSTAAPVLGARFTLLGPSFEAPRSTRLGLSLSRVIGSAALHVSGAYRHTDFLPRRADLNRLAAPSGIDQYGRSLYGTLVQQGSLLAAQANRRFTAFDRVWAVNADGFSDYWGVTVALVREAPRGPRFLASYTHSRTVDNWLGARGGDAAGQLNPFPDSLGGADWANERSDFNVPHRVVVGLELRLPGPFLVSGLYRYETGAPFTPGFRGGVDANGDGADNDPAFVDDAITGVTAVLDRWDCLRTQVGVFAARNSCREPGSHRLDVRLAVEPFQLGGTPVHIVLEGLNLAETEVGVRDHALYLVDRTGTVTTNPTTGVVTVPLIANPAFGDVLTRRSSGRSLRLGVRVGGGW